MLIATAGHVDHGKTLLIRQLTGVDTDRLPEEKARGLSIDLGFAYQALGDDRVLGFVDVPGHERFVRNMLAGVAAIDFALLVVAADDGPMPQTVEHLAILDLLAVTEGAIAVTKIDRVEPARVGEITAEVEALVAETTLAGAPAFAVSGQTGEGVAQLRDHLHGVARAAADRPAGGNFRLAVDRCFTIAGAGLVVTGTVFAGTVRVDDRLVLSPQGLAVRVRAIHANNRDAAVGRAGQRCALNLTGTGLAKAVVHRGDWLLAGPAHLPTRRFDARVRVLPSEARPIRHWTPVHVHLGAADVTARLALLDAKELAPGETALAQLVVDHEIGALAGDRFLLRDQSARRTIAGGRVIDPMSPARGRARPARLDHLAALERPDRADALGQLLRLHPAGLDLAGPAGSWNLTGEERAALFGAVPMVQVATAAGPLGLTPERWQALKTDLGVSLARWHARAPDSVGPTETALRRALPAPAAAEVVAAALLELTRAGAVVRDGVSLRLPDHRPSLTPAEAKLWQRIEPLLQEGGLRPPRVREVTEAVGLELNAVEAFLNRAALLGLLLRVADNRYYPPAAVARLAAIAEDLAAESSDGLFTAANYRDRSGIGRNLTIQVLEFFDKSGFTHRRGEARRIARPAAESFGPSGR